MAELGTQMFVQMTWMSEQLSAQQIALTAKDEHIARRDREIKFKDAMIKHPVEFLWAWLKRHALANFCPDSLDEL